MPEPVLREQIITGSDNVSIALVPSAREFVVRYQAPPTPNPICIYVAIRTQQQIGSAVLPFAQHAEGSTVFLPFKADLLLSAEFRSDNVACFRRQWRSWRWHERERTTDFEAVAEKDAFVFRIPNHLLGDAARLDFVTYAKDPIANNGWGWLWGCSDQSVTAGIGDKYIPHYHALQLEGKTSPLAARRARYAPEKARIRVYQLFVRLFGNINETRKSNGTLLENGVGRFADINDAAIRSLKQLGFTHVWLTGVLQQASATDYSSIGQPADDPDLLKGLAGSPYAIKDYFDVCPDYATDPAQRIREFALLMDRFHQHGLKAIIDLVANHVARSCDSFIRPESNFGSYGGTDAGDDQTKFFDPQNNFFYLKADGNGPPVRLPTWKDGASISPTCQLPGIKCDGLFDGEMTFGRVTGNNVVSWTPGLHDWYETVKLNYGFDFTDPTKSIREYPNAWTPEKPIPDTWMKMDRIIAHWQSLGVDGFRCDMSHMVPPEFWTWIISSARRRSPDILFIGEAYDDDPSKVPGSDPVLSDLNSGRGNVLFDLLNAGFDAVYDAPVYRALKRIYDGSGWANDIDREITEPFICDNAVHYAENHDEVRLAARSQWGGVGMEVGRAVSAILYGLSRGVVMLYNGQEVGEPAEGTEGFGNDDARTSIFDYWSMPELAKWVNGHHYDGGRLSLQQKALREFYGRLIQLVGEPAFHDGDFFPLNPANQENPHFGRMPGEPASGHWLYGFLRYDTASQQRFLILANLHPTISFENVRVLLPLPAFQFLGLSQKEADKPITLVDRLAAEPATSVTSTINEASITGVQLTVIPPLTPLYLEIVS